ncbi:MAG TPA: enolase C-terminal domain-like protein [Candidatus Binatia bacterium]|nr:enolase C-terminal domain-like protein [Candidatus Binatia bacterium]
MKIERLEIFSLSLPYKKPLVTATNKFTVANGIVVRAVSDDGVEGYGYCDPFPRTGETPLTVRSLIEEVLKPIVLGRDLWDLGRIRQEISHRVMHNPRAKSAVQTALFDLQSRSLRVPLFVILGGLVRGEIRVIKMVSLGSPEEMADESRNWVRSGLGALKLKIEGHLALDLERIAAVRNAVGDRVYIKVDANEAYDSKSAIRLARKMADLGVEVFEQPVPRHQIEALQEVKRLSPIKVEADQSVRSVEDAYQLIRGGVADSINTSIQKVGGMVEARQIAEMCQLAGVQCALSNTAGSVLGDAAALQLAVSTPGISPLCEMGEFEVVSGDPFVGLKVEGGVLKVPGEPGLGVRLAGRL